MAHSFCVSGREVAGVVVVDVISWCTSLLLCIRLWSGWRGCGGCGGGHGDGCAVSDARGVGCSTYQLPVTSGGRYMEVTGVGVTTIVAGWW